MSVSRELDELIVLVSKWNKRINLVSSGSLDNIHERHIRDCEQLFSYLNIEDKIVDVGSGAGFPGLVLAILGVKNVTLVESDARKCSFLRKASKFAKGKVKIVNGRVETLMDVECDVVTSRGFASIKKTFEYTKHFNVKKYLLLKGKSVHKEIEEATSDWLFQYKLHDSITDDSGKVIEIFNLSQK